MTHLGERCRIKPILAGQLKADVVGAFRIPRRPGTGLNLRIDSVVVRCRENAEIVGRRDSGSVLRDSVAHRGRIPRDGGLLHIVGRLGASEEALVTNDSVEGGRRTSE